MSILLARCHSTGRCCCALTRAETSSLTQGCTLHATTLTFQTRSVHRYNRNKTGRVHQLLRIWGLLHRKSMLSAVTLAEPHVCGGLWGRRNSYFCFAKWMCQNAFKIFVCSHRLVLVTDVSLCSAQSSLEALEYVTAKCSALNRTSTSTSQGSENVPEQGAQSTARVRGRGSAVKRCLLDKTRSLHSWVHSSHGDPHRIKPVRMSAWIREGPLRLHPHLRSQLLAISNF